MTTRYLVPDPHCPAIEFWDELHEIAEVILAPGSPPPDVPNPLRELLLYPCGPCDGPHWVAIEEEDIEPTFTWAAELQGWDCGDALAPHPVMVRNEPPEPTEVDADM